MNSLKLFCRELQLITVDLTNIANTVIYQDLISSVLAHNVNTNIAIKVPKYYNSPYDEMKTEDTDVIALCVFDRYLYDGTIHIRKPHLCIQAVTGDVGENVCGVW